MTDDEIFAYFDGRQLPEKLRLDRATTQLRVDHFVNTYIQMLKTDSNANRSREMLIKIKNAIETPWAGQEVPTM